MGSEPSSSLAGVEQGAQVQVMEDQALGVPGLVAAELEDLGLGVQGFPARGACVPPAYSFLPLRVLQAMVQAPRFGYP
jgi:hypothetical protein